MAPRGMASVPSSMCSAARTTSSKSCVELISVPSSARALKLCSIFRRVKLMGAISSIRSWERGHLARMILACLRAAGVPPALPGPSASLNRGALYLVIQIRQRRLFAAGDADVRSQAKHFEQLAVRCAEAGQHQRPPGVVDCLDDAEQDGDADAVDQFGFREVDDDVADAVGEQLQAAALDALAAQLIEISAGINDGSACDAPHANVCGIHCFPQGATRGHGDAATRRKNQTNDESG